MAERIDFDELQMYFGEPYVIDLPSAVGKITVYEPTIGDIIKIGQTKFFETLMPFITNPTQNRLALWDAGIDWNTINDFQLFCLLYKTINPEVATLLFGDVDWSDFELNTKSFPDSDEAEVVLWSKNQEIEINEEVYQHFHQYLQTVFKIKPEDELTDSKYLKEWWIRKDRVAQRQKAKKNIKETSMLTLISSCLNHPGFKYKKSELREVGVCEFYDSVSRLQVYETSTACLKGMYSGFVDGSKIDPEQYNFMKNI